MPTTTRTASAASCDGMHFANFVLKRWLHSIGPARRAGVLRKLRIGLQSLKLSRRQVHCGLVQLLASRTCVILVREPFHKRRGSKILREEIEEVEIFYSDGSFVDERSQKKYEDVPKLETPKFIGERITHDQRIDDINVYEVLSPNNSKEYISCKSEKSLAIMHPFEEALMEFEQVIPTKINTKLCSKRRRSTTVSSDMKNNCNYENRMTHIENKSSICQETVPNKALAKVEINTIQTTHEVRKDHLKLNLNSCCRDKSSNCVKSEAYRKVVSTKSDFYKESRIVNIDVTSTANRNKYSKCERKESVLAGTEATASTTSVRERRKRRSVDQNRQRILNKLRSCFGDCISISEDEQERDILRTTYKKRRKSISVNSCDSVVSVTKEDRIVVDMDVFKGIQIAIPESTVNDTSSETEIGLIDNESKNVTREKSTDIRAHSTMSATIDNAYAIYDESKEVTSSRETVINDDGDFKSTNMPEIQNSEEVLLNSTAGHDVDISFVPSPEIDVTTVDNVEYKSNDEPAVQETTDLNNTSEEKTSQLNEVPKFKIRILSSAELGSRWCPTPVNPVTTDVQFSSANTMRSQDPLIYCTSLGTSTTQTVAATSTITVPVAAPTVETTFSNVLSSKDTAKLSKSVHTALLRIYNLIGKIRTRSTTESNYDKCLCTEFQKLGKILKVHDYVAITKGVVYLLNTKLLLSPLLSFIELLTYSPLTYKLCTSNSPKFGIDDRPTDQTTSLQEVQYNLQIENTCAFTSVESLLHYLWSKHEKHIEHTEYSKRQRKNLQENVNLQTQNNSQNNTLMNPAVTNSQTTPHASLARTQTFIQEQKCLNSHVAQSLTNVYVGQQLSDPSMSTHKQRLLHATAVLPSHVRYSDRNVPQTVTQSIPQINLQNVSQTTLQNVPQTTLQNVPQNTFQNVPQATYQSILQSTLQSTYQNVPQTTLKNVPQTTLKNIPQNTFQNAPQTTLKNTSQTTFQNVPRTTFQSILQSTLRNLPLPILQTVPQTTIQNVVQLVLQNIPLTTLQNVPQTTLRDVLQTALQNIPLASLQNAPQTTLQNVLQAAIQNISQTTFQNVPQSMARNVPQGTFQNVPQNDPQRNLLHNSGGILRHPVPQNVQPAHISVQNARDSAIHQLQQYLYRYKLPLAYNMTQGAQLQNSPQNTQIYIPKHPITGNAPQRAPISMSQTEQIRANVSAPRVPQNYTRKKHAPDQQPQNVHQPRMPNPRAPVKRTQNPQISLESMTNIFHILEYLSKSQKLMLMNQLDYYFKCTTWLQQNFMPELWYRINAERNLLLQFQTLLKHLVEKESAETPLSNRCQENESNVLTNIFIEVPKMVKIIVRENEGMQCQIEVPQANQEVNNNHQNLDSTVTQSQLNKQNDAADKSQDKNVPNETELQTSKISGQNVLEKSIPPESSIQDPTLSSNLHEIDVAEKESTNFKNTEEQDLERSSKNKLQQSSPHLVTVEISPHNDQVIVIDTNNIDNNKSATKKDKKIENENVQDMNMSKSSNKRLRKDEEVNSTDVQVASMLKSPNKRLRKDEEINSTDVQVASMLKSPNKRLQEDEEINSTDVQVASMLEFPNKRLRKDEEINSTDVQVASTLKSPNKRLQEDEEINSTDVQVASMLESPNKRLQKHGEIKNVDVEVVNLLESPNETLRMDEEVKDKDVEVINMLESPNEKLRLDEELENEYSVVVDMLEAPNERLRMDEEIKNQDVKVANMLESSNKSLKKEDDEIGNVANTSESTNDLVYELVDLKECSSDFEYINTIVVDDDLSSVENLECKIMNVRSISQEIFNLDEDNTPCLRCGKLSTVVCANCLIAKYCSKKCSTRHWRHHFKDCNSVMNYSY